MVLSADDQAIFDAYNNAFKAATKNWLLDETVKQTDNDNLKSTYPEYLKLLKRKGITVHRMIPFMTKYLFPHTETDDVMDASIVLDTLSSSLEKYMKSLKSGVFETDTGPSAILTLINNRDFFADFIQRDAKFDKSLYHEKNTDIQWVTLEPMPEIGTTAGTVDDADIFVDITPHL